MTTSLFNKSLRIWIRTPLVSFAPLQLTYLILFLMIYIQEPFFFSFFFLHITQHSIQNITKLNNRHILNISRSNQKGAREGRTTRTKNPWYNHVYLTKNTGKHQWSKALAPRRCTFTRHYFAGGYRSNMFFYTCGVNQFCIIVFFAAVEPANNIFFCIELIQRPESSLRRHKLGLTDQSIRSNDDKTRFTFVQ